MRLVRLEPDRPGDHRPEERPQRHLLPARPAGTADHHDLLLGLVPLLLRGRGRRLIDNRADAGEEAPVDEPAHGGQLVGVVQRAPRVPHRLAAGLSCLWLTRHGAIRNSRRSSLVAGGRKSCNAMEERRGRDGGALICHVELATRNSLAAWVSCICSGLARKR